jgi:hypothetical protein
MICIKTVKSLTINELKGLNLLIDTYYKPNTLLQNEIVIYSKINDDIIGCICVIPKKGIISNLCVKIEYWNMSIEKELILMAKNIAGESLIVYISDEGILKTYYSKHGFIPNGEQTMILLK